MSRPIEDYAVIGDCHTAGLVSRDGSIDWLCIPRFDSAACFAALLGTADNGHWSIRPAGEIRKSTRRYRDNTLILETDFETAEGAVTIVDCMPPRTDEPDIVRVIIGRRGAVKMRMEFVIRFDYGSIVPWVSKSDEGLRAIAGPDTLLLRTPVATRGEDLTTVAEFIVAEGEQTPFVLCWHRSHDPCPREVDAAELIQFAEDWWRAWSGRCKYNGPWRSVVMRSLITLKALTYAPTGGLVAAPTTSLPEQLGGVRNWDYRYCWLRDATFTLDAMLLAGYHDEARSWRDWLVRAVAGKPDEIQIMYGLAGERRLTELELDWLSGYEGSRPVRIGNAASRQFQLDVYGEVLDMMHQCRRSGLDVDPYSWRVEQALIKFLEVAWHNPDEGIWEVRGPRRHFTHSKMMAWVAMDRAVKAVERYGRDGPIEQWRKTRDEIHAEVCALGFNSRRKAFVQSYGSDQLDASLLMMPLVGFLPARDPRVRGTVEAIERDLMEEGFVQRYATASGVDGLPPGEGAFIPCTFWLVDNYILLGRMHDAQRLFERLLGICNDVGLLAEQYDTKSGRLVGNFPQAFSHLALVGTARNLLQTDGPAHRGQD